MGAQAKLVDETQLERHFGFGENWAKLIEQIDDQRLARAIEDIRSFVGDLRGREFLDIGCGCGLSSLAAYHLGASKIISLDIDPLNIENTLRLKAKFGVPELFPWTVETRSIVSDDDVRHLEMADVVYSWGVLHHTGAMWHGINNAASLVRPDGFLYLMLYRDAVCAPLWKAIKRTYVASPNFIKFVMRNAFAGAQISGMLIKHRSPAKVRKVIREYGDTSRGMSWYIDSTDWIGGYPFEYAEAEEVIAFCRQRGFELNKLFPEITPRSLGVRGTGSYQYLFQRQSSQ
jgi:2-polyprenyl-6-hydroxyphenyl methylase/3-demethylubiquinone-9 3-methyltransferase